MFVSRAWYVTSYLRTICLKAIHTRLLWTLFSLASAALLLRIGGMVNQILTSEIFGASAAMDAYFVAAALPLLLLQLMNSALEAAVIPVYSKIRQEGDERAVSNLFSTLLNSLFLCAVLMTLLLVLFRQQLLFLSAPGLDRARFAQALELTPLLYLVMLPGLLIGLLESLLNAERQFGWPAYAGLLVPLTTALLIWLAGRSYGVPVLCLGMLIGTILQLLVVLLRSARAGLRYRWILDFRQPAFGCIVRTIWPVLLGALICQGSSLIDQIFASLLPVGSIAALSYALKLVSMCSGIIFVSLGRALLPVLAHQASLSSGGTYQAFKRTLRRSLWGVGLGTFFLSMLVFFLAQPIVALLFQRGAFLAVDSRQTALLLQGFSLGLVPMALSFLLTRAFSALGETRIPMYVALVSMGANLCFDALFTHFWQGLGIALATSLVYIVSCGLLLILLYRRIGTLELLRVPRLFFRSRYQMLRKNAPILRSSFQKRPGSSGGTAFWLRKLSLSVLALLTLVFGVAATFYNSILALRGSMGLFLMLCLIRYPHLLLLAWASINVFIGSTLAVFNGNNLNTLLVLPLPFVLSSLPWRQIIERMPAFIWLLLYLLEVLIGIGYSPLESSDFIILWLTMMAFLAVSALTIALLTTRRLLFGVIDTLLAVALFAALYGLYGYITHQWGELDRETSLFRITSFFTQATTFAFYLSLLFPLAISRCLILRGWKRCGGVLTALCLLLSLLLTFTRSAYISLYVSLLILAANLAGRSQRLLVTAGLLFLGSLAIFLAWSGELPVLARFFSGDVLTLNGRTYLWQALLMNFQATSWLGNGLQSSDVLLGNLRVGELGRGVIGTAPHSLFLGTLYDHGVIGLGLLTGTFLSLAWQLLKGLRSSNGEQRLLCAAAFAAFISMLLQSFTSRDLWIQAIGIPFWLVMAFPFSLFWPRFLPILKHPLQAPQSRREQRRGVLLTCS